MNNEWSKYLLKWEKWEFLTLFYHEMSKYSQIMQYYKIILSEKDRVMLIF